MVGFRSSSCSGRRRAWRSACAAAGPPGTDRPGRSSPAGRRVSLRSRRARPHRHGRRPRRGGAAPERWRCCRPWPCTLFALCRTAGWPRRCAARAVLAGYLVAATVGLLLCTDLDTCPAWPLVALWLPRSASASTRPRALPEGERGRAPPHAVDRLGAWPWPPKAGLVVLALRLLTDWPHAAGAVALAITGLVPLAIIAGTQPKMVARVDRLLIHTVALAGLTALVVARLPARRARPRPPPGRRRADAAAAVDGGRRARRAAVPARPARLTELANRRVYGERDAPDEVLRTFGSGSPGRSRWTSCCCSSRSR